MNIEAPNGFSEKIFTDLLPEICKSLDVKNTLSTRKVCIEWKKIIDDNDLIWKNLSENKWPDYHKKPHISWLEHFRSNYKGLFSKSLNYYNSKLFYIRNDKIYYHNFETNHKNEKQSGHLGSVNQLYIYNHPRFDVKLITCGSDGALVMWDNINNETPVFRIQVHPKSINCLFIANPFIFTGSDDGSIKLLELNKLLELKSQNVEEPLKFINELNWHKNAVTCLQVCREGKKVFRLFSGSRDTTICISKITIDGKCELEQTLHGHTSTVTALKIHNRIHDCLIKNPTDCLISGSVDRTIKIWSKNRNNKYECLQTLNIHQSTITSLLADPFSPIFYSGSLDGKICCWKYEPDQNWILTYMNSKTNTEYNDLKFKRNSVILQDRKQICSMTTTGQVTLWNKTQEKISFFSTNTRLSFETEII